MKTRDLQSEDSLAAAFQQRRRFRGTLIWGLTLVLLLAVVSGRTQEPQPAPEGKIKAAFLFNFAKYVEWPAEAFSDKTSPLVIGVLGKSTIHGALGQTISDKTINDRSIQIKEFPSVAEATNCHILFISSSEKDRLPKIFAGLRDTDAHALTVGETDGFIQAGGMINFVPFKGNKIRFEINDEPAKKAKLKISSQLLNLAIRSAH